MKSIALAVALLVGGTAFGQTPYAPLVPVQPNQQVQVQVAPGNPGVATLPAVPFVGPPIHEWRDGVREEWKTVHEIRPVRDYDYGYLPQAVPGAYVPQQLPYRADGFYMNGQGCWQRDLPQQWLCPQQWYTQPQVCYPRYQRWGW